MKIVKPDFQKKERVTIKKAKFCRHKSCVVDEYSRTVECHSCGAALDAFDFLFQWAMGYRSLTSQHESLQRDIEKLQGIIVELERLERNAKARLRNKERKKNEN